MLILSKDLVGQPVLSLRTGGQIAIATEPIINPNNLKIEGFYCQDRFSSKTLILLTQDIRDKLNQGIVVNDHEVLVEPEELIRLKDILELKFILLDKPVVTIGKQKLGKVSDYAIDTASLYVQKVYVGQSLLKSFSGGNLSVDRTQIIEVTDRKVVVAEPLKPVKAGVRQAVRAALPAN